MPKEDKLKIEALKLLEKIKESEEAESKRLKKLLVKVKDLENIVNYTKNK